MLAFARPAHGSIRFVFLLLTVGGFFGVTHGNAASKSLAPNHQVFLFKGLMNIFSQGMVQLETKLAAKGVNAVALNHSKWTSTAEQIKAMSRKNRGKLVIIGHSFGGNAAILLANELSKNKIRVDYVVTLDAGRPQLIKPGTRRMTNYYIEGFGPGKIVKRAPGFRGKLKNVNLKDRAGYGHFNIDKQVKLQNQIIKDVLRVLKR